MDAVRWLRRGQDESGQAIVTMALASVFLMMILAIVVETGFAYMERRNLQNAADAAALAAAHNLPGNPTQAVADALAFASANVPGVADHAIVISGDGQSVTSTVGKKATTLFAGWFSIGAWDVTAEATARVRSLALPGPGVVPLTVNQTTYEQAAQSGAVISLKFPGGQGENGNYQIIDIASSPGSAVCTYLKGGSTKAITDPGTSTEPGAKNGLARCINERMNAARTNGCFSYNEVTSGGVLLDRCNPYSGAKAGSAGYPGIQPTAVVLMPIATDATFNTGTNGSKPISLVQDASGGRLFAFFLIDASTVDAVDGGPYCPDSGGGGGGQCEIRGRFLTSFSPVVLPSGTTGQLTSFTSTSIFKLVELTD